MSSAPLCAQTASIPKVWNGEIVEADQGLITLYAIIIDSKVKHRQGSFSFHIKGRKSGLTYSVSAQTQEPKLPPNQIWKVREDTYDLVDISLADERGKNRKWKGPYSKALVVTPKAISSLGVWYLATLADDQFKVLLKPIVPKIELGKWKGSVTGLTNGFTGEFTKRYKAEAEAKGFGFRKVIRATRSIDMRYGLDLFKMNTHARDMVRVIETNDGDIRSCYTDLLDKSPDSRGKLIYSFVYSGIDQGIKSLKIKENTIKNSEFQECLYFKLRGLTFPLRQSLAGELSFQFNFVE